APTLGVRGDGHRGRGRFGHFRRSRRDRGLDAEGRVWRRAADTVPGSADMSIIVPGGIAHPDQTTKQPVIWRCPNPECRESNLANYYEFESDYPECPKCKLGPPSVRKRVLIHVLVRDPKGPIAG